jgi:hypothetical protein
MGNERQNEFRERMARKTRRIVEKQEAVSLEEFIRQGQRRSRQQRAIEVESMTQAHKIIDLSTISGMDSA